jgi:hypothetical protein
MGGFLERVSIPRRLEATALAVYAIVFVLLLEFGRPGLGISQGFYVGIVLIALVDGPVSGVGAGLLAALLCGVAGAARGDSLYNGMASPLAVRLAAFTLAGLAVGYFARRGRQMLSDSLAVLDELMRLARREVSTGVLSSDGIHARILARLESERPFAVFVGEMLAPTETGQRELLRRLAAAAPESDIAKVGRRVAVVAAVHSADHARDTADTLGAAAGVRFGFAFHPQDGDDPLSLFGAASERL